MARITNKYYPKLATILRIPKDTIIGNNKRLSVEFPIERG